MSGPWQELAAGRLGTTAAELVYETVDAVRRFDRYPPPPGEQTWTSDAVMEFAHDFLYGEGGPERLTRLVATATDETSFERVLEAAVRNAFRMRARSTDTGAALRALTHAVELDNQIVTAGATTTTRTWSLSGHENNMPYAGPVADLIGAAYATEGVRRARWPADSTRRAPIAESDSLRRIIHAVLEAAAAPVSPRMMLEVILARFPLVAPAPADFSDELVAALPDGSDTALLAAELWEELNDNERLVSGVLDLPVREMAEATGLSNSTAGRASLSARAVMSAFLKGVDDQAGVIAAIAAASAALRERGTIRSGSASNSGERR